MTARRVAMVLNTLGYGGVPEAALNLAHHLPRDRYAPQVFVLKGDTPDPALQRRIEKAGIPVTFARATDGKIGTIAELAAWIAEQNVSILHCHSYRPNLYARMAGALHRPAGLRVVAHYHNQYDDKWLPDSPALLLERQLVGVTDAMIAVSASVRAHVADRLALPADRIILLPNGVTPDKVRPIPRAEARAALGIAAGDLAIGLIGRICAQKGQEDMVEAALFLQRTRPEALILMIGAIEDAALHRRLVTRIADQGATDRIRFTGHLPDIAPAYAALDILVAPSRWEGFGLMLVEAMAAGLPIIASDVGAIPEVTGGAATLVPPSDPVALAAEIAAMDAPARDRASAAGRLRAQTFCWPTAANHLAALYDRLPCP
jgi:glycosyltransferase involved in cell wall biosynthesis